MLPSPHPSQDGCEDEGVQACLNQTRRPHGLGHRASLLRGALSGAEEAAEGPARTGRASTGQRGRLPSPVDSGHTDLKRFYFSTVFAALLWGQGFLRARPAFQGHTESSPNRKHHVFNLQVPARLCERTQLPGGSDPNPRPAAAGNPRQSGWRSRTRGTPVGSLRLLIPGAGSLYSFVGSRCT